MRAMSSLKLTRHVLRLMGPRMTSVYGSAQLLDTSRPGTAIRRSMSTTNDFHNKSSLILTLKRKSGSGGGSSNNGDPPNHRKSTGGSSSSTTTAPPASQRNNKSDSSSSSSSSSQRDVPRRIVVKKKPENQKEEGKNKQLKQKQRVGVLKRRFPLQNEIQDTNGKTIWVPPKVVVGSSTSSNRPYDEKNATVQLPQIRAGAWLDPGMYCRGGGKTIAGTEAARKLLRGKKDLIELLGYAVHDQRASCSITSTKQSDDAFVLQSHGIPPQVLQHHVDFAAHLLLRLQAQEVSFKQFNQSKGHNSVAAVDAVKSIRHVHVRDAVTGENQVVAWPFDEERAEHLLDDLTLYWTVMNRIATRLGVAVLLKRPGMGRLDDHPLNESSALSSPTNSMLKTPPHHWKVAFQRGLHFAPEQLPPTGRPSSTQQLHPVVEWTPLKGVAAPGHCCIRLQGSSILPGGDQQNAFRVSLSFDACFRVGSTVTT